MKRLLLLGAAALSAAVVTVPASPAQAATCANADFVIRPLSAFPDTPRGRSDFMRQRSTIERSVLCLVNAERTARGLRIVTGGTALGNPLPLRVAAARHAADAVRIKWWGTVAEVGDCVPRRDKPSECDYHVNPVTRTDPRARAQAVGYCKSTAIAALAENTYWGVGREEVTPRAAVAAWMESDGHRANILGTAFTSSYTQVAYGSPNPVSSGDPAVAYVQMFGRCA
ncbi:CAP domain-containing protein [Herbidospora sp. RD11066]